MSKLLESYRVQDGCWNCKRVLETGDREGGVYYRCLKSHKWPSRAKDVDDCGICDHWERWDG